MAYIFALHSQSAFVSILEAFYIRLLLRHHVSKIIFVTVPRIQSGHLKVQTRAAYMYMQR